MRQNWLKRFFGSRTGNVAMVYALCLPAIMLSIGIAIDFGRAAQLRTKLNGAADAAALAALTPAMMQSNTTTAQHAAEQMFIAQASPLKTNEYAVNFPSVSVTYVNNNPNHWAVSVCYSGSEPTMFAGVLKTPALSFGNCSSATAEVAPNIDFYLLLDNSPSMSLPSTSAGITAMQNLTTASGSCAFACHQASSNNGDTNGNPCNSGYTLTNLGNNQLYCTSTTNTACSNGASPTKATVSGKNYYYCSIGEQIDNYALARQNNITLRLDEVTSAVQTMMATAQTTINTTPYNPAPVLPLRRQFHGLTVADRVHQSDDAHHQFQQCVDDGLGELWCHGNVLQRQRLQQCFLHR